MTDRNWALILAVVCGFATAFVALFANVSENTFLLRVSIGVIVGALVGFGFDIMMATAGIAGEKPAKGGMIDFTLNEANPANEFVPLDYQKATKVVQQMMREE